MERFIKVNERKYHRFRDCKWIEKHPEEKIFYCDAKDIVEQSPCISCTKRKDLLDGGFSDEEVQDILDSDG